MYLSLQVPCSSADFVHQLQIPVSNWALQKSPEGHRFPCGATEFVMKMKERAVLYSHILSEIWYAVVVAKVNAILFYS